MKTFCPALLVWFLSLAGVNESVRPQVESTTVSQAVSVPAEEGEPVQETTRVESGLYFPDYVDGGGWSVQLAISNVARRVPAAVVVTAYDQDGHPLPELFDSETTFEIPPLGSQVLRSVGTGEIRRGWIEVQSVPPAVSGLLTYRHAGSGVEVGVAPVRLGDRFALFVEESSEIGTGLALFKPEADSEVEIRIRDEAGSDPLGQDLTVGDFQQRALTLPEWFQTIGATFPGDFRGQLLLRSGEDSLFAPIGLRFGKRKTSLSAVPGIPFSGEGGDGPPNPFQPTTSTAGPLYFPDYVDGGGWSVQLALGNLDADRSVPVEIEVYDQHGRSVRGLFDSESRFELPAQGSQVLKSAGGTQIRRGWIKVQANSASVRGLLVYRHAETGIEVGVAPVEPRDQFALFVEETSEIGTGLALFKPETGSRVEFRIRDEAGNDPLGDVYVPWRNFRQSARTLSEWFDVDGVETGFLKDFRGLLFLRTEDGSEFAPLGLRFGKGTSALSAVPGIGIVDGVRIAAGVGSDGGVEIDGGVGIDGGGMAPPPTVTLSVSPSSIDRGQSATLRWSSTNSDSVEITPDVGKVSTSGTQKVSPRRTTTYRITVTAADGQTATASVTVTVAISERAALEAFYEATNGPNWVNNENWLTDAPLGVWYGVETDASGRVTGLRLAGQYDRDRGTFVSHGLLGPIPPELGSLSNLKILDLNDNLLTGAIPAELGSLVNLERLMLSSNQLSGRIPPELGNLTELRILDLSVNETIEGEIPPELGNLTKLVELHLWRNKLQGRIPSELGHLTEMSVLWLEANNLHGEVPRELGNLTQMRALGLSSNALTGTLPTSLLRLERLVEIAFSDNDGLCAPGTVAFAEWLDAMEHNERHGPFCNQYDIAALESLYESASGEDWTNSTGWLSGPALDRWHGVVADSVGRVVELDLSQNGLAGRISAGLVDLDGMASLRVGGNALVGPLPLGLAGLSLRELHYADTQLCVPDDSDFRAWLNSIPSHDGTDAECELSDHDVLVALYEATDGPNWVHNDNWLTNAPLGDWHGISVDGAGRIVNLDLRGNNLTGPIPPEVGSLTELQDLDLSVNYLRGEIPRQLGNLTNLRRLWLLFSDLEGEIPQNLGDLRKLSSLNLGSNDLRGEIPPELGSLTELRFLNLGGNSLKGTIPPELGNLKKLDSLWLGYNNLRGRIPPELGSLANLKTMLLEENGLEGEIPPELGNLKRLERLEVSGNRLAGQLPPELGVMSELREFLAGNNMLSGPLPAEFGDLTQLQVLSLYNNPGLTGPLPESLIPLPLSELAAGDTALCAPDEPRFREWLRSIGKRRVPICGVQAEAYLTQAAQSREYPVPLVAGESALLRVFVTSTRETTANLPPVRTTFFLNGEEIHVVEIPAGSATIPTEVREEELDRSANAEIPARVIQPGLEMVIEVDPSETVDPSLGVSRRIPGEGRMAVDVRAMPTLNLTLVPFVWTGDHDRRTADLVEELHPRHELFWETNHLLPVGAFEIMKHEPVLTDSNSGFDLLGEVALIRKMEGGNGDWQGLMYTDQPPGGIAYLGGSVSFSKPYPKPMAHELGHHFNLGHAPCGPAGGPDPAFPHPSGWTGVWGYDPRDAGSLVSPNYSDLMGYCGSYWISDYHFTNALGFRLHTNTGSGLSSLVRAPTTSLLIWGGVDAAGVPFLEPTFVVKAPISLPPSNGEHQIIGRNTDGDELFSLTFEMPEMADGDGSSSFVFVLPVQPGWADELAGITLSGPGGSVTLDEDTDRPVTILRNPRTGQIRAILRGEAAASQNLDATVSALSSGTKLERLTSRGIPNPEDWAQ